MTEPRVGEEMVFRHPHAVRSMKVKVVARRGQGIMWIVHAEDGRTLIVSAKHLRRE